jgi:hypothetical protein
MKNIMAIICLSLPSLLLGIKCRIEYGSKIQLSFGGWIALTVLIVYILLVAVFGANNIEGLDENYLIGENLKRFSAFFIFPGISIAIILFPKVAAEYTEYYLPLVKTGSLSAFSLAGWTLLFISVLSALVWYG